MRKNDDFDLLIITGLALVLAYLFTKPKVSYVTEKQKVDTFSGGPSAPAAKGARPNWDCITHRERLQIIKDPATVVCTVIPAGDGGAHYAPDGDLVFSCKPDPQYAHMLLPPNTSNKKYGGGLWIEGVCQKPNKAKEPRHAGDCKCSPTKFAAPKNGQKLKITGAHIKDVGEDGHAEIHPVYTMEVVS